MLQARRARVALCAAAPSEGGPGLPDERALDTLMRQAMADSPLPNPRVLRHTLSSGDSRTSDPASQGSSEDQVRAAVAKYHLRDKEKIISCLPVIEPSVTALLHSLLGSLSLAAAVMETLFFSRRETQSEARSNKACVISPSRALSLSPL